MLKVLNSTKKDGNMSPVFSDEKISYQNKLNFFMKNSISNAKTLKIKINYKDDIFVLKDSFIKKNTDLSKMEINTDCIITKEKGIFLYLYFADCIPLVIYDKKNEILAFAHMGWQSIELNLHKKIINKLKTEYNSDINDLKVIIGPSIKKESYILKNPSQLKFKEWQPFLIETKKDYYMIDLLGYLESSLKNCGIKDLEISNINTASNEEYFSHYRCIYINKDEKEGRFIYGAMIENN